MINQVVTITKKRENELYDALKKKSGSSPTCFVFAFNNFDFESAIQVENLFPLLLKLIAYTTQYEWSGNICELQLISRLLVIAVGVLMENFTFSKYVIFIRTLEKTVKNLHKIANIHSLTMPIFRSNEYIHYTTSRLVRLKSHVISQVDSTMPWPDYKSNDKLCALHPHCFRYMIKNYLSDPQDLLSLALTNSLFFSLIFELELLKEILYTHFPGQHTNYIASLPIGIVVDKYKVACFIMKYYYYQRCNMLSSMQSDEFLMECLTCGRHFWPFQIKNDSFNSGPDYNHFDAVTTHHNISCLFPNCSSVSPKNFAAYLNRNYSHQLADELFYSLKFKF